MQTAHLLSDEFANFSGKITALHERKKEMQAEFRKLYEQHKAAVKEIDQEAAALLADFEQWQQNGTKEGDE